MAPLKNIWVAAGDGDLDRVRYLIEQESLSPDIPDEFTYTPMHAAASYGHLNVLEYLISKGGDVNVTDDDGDTPLYTVEDVATARFLVEKGAQVDRQNKEGVSPIDHLQEEFGDVANYLQSLVSPATAVATETAPQPSQQEQEMTSDRLASALMSSVDEIMRRAEREGTDPDEELRRVVGQTVLEGMLEGYSMSEPSEENDRESSPNKRPRTDDGPG
ncbi:unnamed protein product [Mycena citricolor]|uniref:Ankyrin n=1 Tax=Mycena citricolor TaxID=2018698 RepID=A0AAD2H4A1_9AGAR|nr:unnamed protein product [Mycena citricolor]CAK5269132.1 unnamed protein product [Mycena citricolor]